MKSSRKLKESDKKIIASIQEWKCKACYRLLSSTYQIDHIVPFSIYNDDSMNNLQALCANCHTSKTQQESRRITKFKKLRAKSGKNICWYCLKEVVKIDDHACTKVPSDIEISERSSYQCDPNLNFMDQFAYLSIQDTDTKNKNIGCVSDETLNIKLTNSYIWVNNFFTNCSPEDYTVHKIADAIAVVTSGEIHKYKDVSIEITIGIELEEEVSDEMIDYIHKYLPSLIPTNIFIPGTETVYTFLC